MSITPHLSPDLIVQIAETSGAHPHLEACAACRARVDGVRAALAAARAVPLPEPSPLFWSRFPQRVRAALDAEAARPRRQFWSVPGWRAVSSVAAAAALVIAVAVWFVGKTPSAPDEALRPGIEGMAGAVTEGAVVQDDAWGGMAGVARELEFGEAVAAGFDVLPGSAERAAAQLTPDEQRELIRLLRTAVTQPE